MEWCARYHLAVRARAQRGDCRHRHAACPLGGFRCTNSPSAAARASPQRRRREERGSWWLADQHNFPYSSRLPLFSRGTGTACNVPGPFRAGCIAILSRSHRRRVCSIRPRGRSLHVTAFEPVSAFNLYRGRGNRIEESVRRSSLLTTTRILPSSRRESGWRNEPAASGGGLQPLELAHVHGWSVGTTRRSTPTSRVQTSAGGTAR